MNLEHIFVQNNPVIIATFVLLAAMSVTSWYLMFWKAYHLHKDRKALAYFKSRYTQTPDWPRHGTVLPVDGSVDLLVENTERLKSVILSCTHEERRDILSMHLVQTLDNIRLEFDKGLTALASIGSCAPFIGLFGTVWGITGALSKIAAEGNAGLSVVAGPMGEALVMTAVGLFTAIPAVFVYNGLVRLNRVHVQNLRHIAEQMAIYIPLKLSSGRQPVHAPETIKLVRDEH